MHSSQTPASGDKREDIPGDKPHGRTGKRMTKQQTQKKPNEAPMVSNALCYVQPSYRIEPTIRWPKRNKTERMYKKK